MSRRTEASNRGGVNETDSGIPDLKEIVKKYAQLNVLDMLLDMLDIDPEIKEMIRMLRKARTPEEKRAVKNYFMIRLISKTFGKQAQA